MGTRCRTSMRGVGDQLCQWRADWHHHGNRGFANLRPIHGKAKMMTCPMCTKEMKSFWGDKTGCVCVHTDGTRCERKTGLRMEDPPLGHFDISETPKEQAHAH